ATAPPPINEMNSRRLIASPEAQDKASYRQTSPLEGGSEMTPPMSALGQKRTFAPQKVMSALPPKATSNATYGMTAKGQKRTFISCSITRHAGGKLFFECPRIRSVIPSVCLYNAVLDQELAAHKIATGKTRVADTEVSIGLDPPIPVVK